MPYTPRRFKPANLSRESTPWGREIEQAIEEHDRELYRRGQGEENANKGQNSSMKRLAATVAALPVPTAYYQRADGFSLAGPLYLQQTGIPIPPGKTKVALTAIGNVAALDTTSAGVAVARASIEVNGNGFVWTSPTMPASKDAGASAVNNIITPALGFQQEGLVPGETFLVSLNVTATNGAAFPTTASNFATLAITAIFFS